MLKYFLLFIFLYEFIQKSDVYFIKTISSENIVKMFQKLNVTLTGNVGLKIHTGESGGKYFLHPNFLQKIYDATNGTFIECNTAYSGNRHTTDLHKSLLNTHGWLDNNRRTVIMDENPSDDFELPIENHNKISKDIVGGRLKEFNSCLVLSHFKGHSMGGFGGALKQLSIGFASQAGKAYIHTAGVTSNWRETWSKSASQADFTASMGDAASSIVKYFRDRGGIAFINVMANISKSCDCAGASAPTPRIHDIGILASTDPVAIDRACYDLISKDDSEGVEDWLSNSKRLYGENTIDAAEKLGIGTQEYNLINVEDDSEQENQEKVDENNENDNITKLSGVNYYSVNKLFVLLLFFLLTKF